MSPPLRSFALISLLMGSIGCGYMAQTHKKVEYASVALGPRRGSLWRYAAPGCPPCTEAYLRAHWGEPSSRAVDEQGIDVWTYENGLRWVGGSPIVILPLPLFVPSGKERIHVGIKEGRIVFIRHDTVRRRLYYIPIAQSNDITAGLYESTAPDSGCVFHQAP